MIKMATKAWHHFQGDLLVFFALQRKNKRPWCADPIRKIVRRAWRAGDFKAKAGETLLLHPALFKSSDFTPMKCRQVLIVGMGEREIAAGARREQLRVAAGHAAVTAGRQRRKSVGLVLPDVADVPAVEIAECVCEGLLLANYAFDRYRRLDPDQEDRTLVKAFTLLPEDLPSDSVHRGMQRGQNSAAAALLARDMANEPANVWTPERFARMGRELAKGKAFACTVLDKAAMKKLGMGGILAVNQGSVRPPRLVALEYRTGKKVPVIMLVGKGLTFDSGGISLKPAAGMQDMKYDMCGGAAVMAVMDALGREKGLRVDVVGLVPATENMGGGGAMKPGDIIRHYGGKTSEVVNTDAEGRLILADALAWGIETYKPDCVIDLATLTGAVIVALGHHHTGLLANNQALADRLLAAGDHAGEPLWQLPLGSEYSKQLKSTVADLKNIGGKSAGTITAAAYLQEFVGKVPWAHLDIAGTAWKFTEKSYVPKGPSGVGVRTLLALLRDWEPLKK